jgi:CDP-glucose 4,6-dehydratase
MVNKMINKYKPQVIFHIAAEAIVGEANKDPVKAFKSNIEGTWNILEASRGRKFIEAIVVASSDKAYGSHKVLPYKEDAPLKGSHPYDVSKSCADLICYAYWNTYRVPVCVTRCGNIYGPGDFNYSRVVPDAIRCAIQDKQFKIRSDGKFTRDYVYVEDIVNGYITLAEKMKKLKLYGEAFNFSDENPITVIEMVKKIYHLSEQKPDYKILNSAKYEIKHQYLCSKKARKVLSWKPEYSLDEGLKKTLKWYGDVKK